MNTLVKNTPETAVTKILSIGMTAHSGIVGDKDDLFILELTDQELTPKQGTQILYELAKVTAKLTGKPFVTWQDVQVDLNFNQTGKAMVFHKYFNPHLWDGEIIYCSPNDKLIEYVKTRCK
jgi:hypothetical protein